MKDLIRLLVDLETAQEQAKIFKNVTKAAVEDIACKWAIEKGLTPETFAPIVAERAKELFLEACGDSIEVPGMREEVEYNHAIFVSILPHALKLFFERAQQ